MSKKQPMKVHEDVLVFGTGKIFYFPVMSEGKPYLSGKGTLNVKNIEKIGKYILTKGV